MSRVRTAEPKVGLEWWQVLLAVLGSGFAVLGAFTFVVMVTNQIMRALMVFLVMMTVCTYAQVPRATVQGVMNNVARTQQYENSDQSYNDMVYVNQPACGSNWSFESNDKPRILFQGSNSYTYVSRGNSAYFIDNTSGKFMWFTMPKQKQYPSYNYSLTLWNVPVADASWQTNSQLISYLWPQSPRRRK